MAGTYTRKEFALEHPEEQTLLKDSNGTRIIPLKGIEPVRLSPGWEGTDRPDYELNFKGMTMDQADLELNPPKDRLKLVYMVLLLHGIGVLMPWNMFITADKYFINYKLSPTSSNPDPSYQNKFMIAMLIASQLPNLFFNWMNVFVHFGGSLTTRIVCGIILQILIYLLTIVLAMIDTVEWTPYFYWITLVSIFTVGMGNGVYQNSIYGMAAKLPPEYTGAVVLGSNLSGTVVAVIRVVIVVVSPNERTSAIYFFITALFVLLACFDTYFALPINRFYRYHELMNQSEINKKQLESSSTKKPIPPYLEIFKQCYVQCFNTFLIFSVTLTLFPMVLNHLRRSDENFFITDKYYSEIICYLIFNVMAMLGSLTTSFVQWPSKKYLIIPVVLRILFIPLFLICNYHIEGRTMPILIKNDWVHIVLSSTMGFTSGYLSSLSMTYCSRTVKSEHAATAGMLGAAFLITGICAGILLSKAFISILLYKDNPTGDDISPH